MRIQFNLILEFFEKALQDVNVVVFSFPIRESLFSVVLIGMQVI